jgi:3-oxoacyl-[acyl-carrier protein] reductase
MPGIVETDLIDVMPDAIREQRVKDTPLGRFGQPDDVAGTVAFHASDAARFVTGTSLRVDGGLRMAVG